MKCVYENLDRIRCPIVYYQPYHTNYFILFACPLIFQIFNFRHKHIDFKIKYFYNEVIHYRYTRRGHRNTAQLHVPLWGALPLIGIIGPNVGPYPLNTGGMPPLSSGRLPPPGCLLGPIGISSFRASPEYRAPISLRSRTWYYILMFVCGQAMLALIALVLIFKYHVFFINVKLKDEFLINNVNLVILPFQFMPCVKFHCYR